MNTSSHDSYSLESTHQLISHYVLPNYGRSSLVPVRGEGVWLWDEDGKRYLDFNGGVAVCSLGHCPPVLTLAISEQAGKLIHCSNWFSIRQQAEVSRILSEEVLQESGRCFFCNSGTEANETLIKVARRFGRAFPAIDGQARYQILTFSQSFHGRTYGGLSATAQKKIHDGCEPILPGFTYLPFNDCDALERAITSDVAAILLEPVQGEGGVHSVTIDFLRKALELCNKHNLLLFFDEVQSGLGRCGELRGWHGITQENGIIPDAVSWAKGLGSGFPVGAVWVRERLFPEDAPTRALPDLMGPGSHGSTFGGSPLACAAATAVLREIIDKKLSENASEQGKYILETVTSWNSPFVKESRGHGLLLGFALNTELFAHFSEIVEGRTPSMFLFSLLQSAGLLTAPAGPDVIRWLPALNVTREEVDIALTIFQKVLQQLA